VLRANGHTPLWIGKGKLAPESRAALRTIDLQSSRLRLERALAKMEQANGFAHHSHTDASERPAEGARRGLRNAR
jgi:hypothetical protein